MTDWLTDRLAGRKDTELNVDELLFFLNVVSFQGTVKAKCSQKLLPQCLQDASVIAMKIERAYLAIQSRNEDKNLKILETALLNVIVPNILFAFRKPVNRQ